MVPEPITYFSTPQYFVQPEFLEVLVPNLGVGIAAEAGYAKGDNVTKLDGCWVMARDKMLLEEPEIFICS